ncbi:hypothetical protein M1247_00170 [Mycobacterium sp. 21AC1]|uniref:hypothetical protein n=1 Tax=[Mycobacterium] appelbergii TaxID=2939269 RepID=UPI002938F79A|nr:hypothetical protein [Mycobacterium sp. 21AC1]MDV3123316.1 hypothetical protein [Mycobacterium sp. 21AC1]
MTGELRVNPPELRAGGLGMSDAAASLPDPPAMFTTSGTDPLSVALQRVTQEKEAAFIEGLPGTRADAKGTATNIGVAADQYEKTDQEIHDNVKKSLAEFDSMYGPPAGGGAQDAMGQFGQLMQMPMQMLQQMGQVPTQMLQRLGQLPQTAMQGVQQGIQQISQVAGEAAQKEDAQKPDDGREEDAQKAKHDEQARPNEVEGATAEPSAPERAPVAAPHGNLGTESSPLAPPVEPVPRRAPSDPSILL